MKIFHFRSQLWLPHPRTQVFEFFSNALNLEELTPPWLKFHVTTPQPIQMREGTEIAYRLKIRGIPVRWKSRITAWDPPNRFVDEQLRGPYRVWIHEHKFTDDSGGTACEDHVQYATWGGALINKLLVQRDIGQIFAYRTARLQQLFPNREQPRGEKKIALPRFSGNLNGSLLEYMLNDPLLLNDWQAVARASALHPGDVQAARLLGTDLVLWHDGREIHAWLDQCAHRGTKLSLGKVRDQQLVCTYHGWCYDDSGMCTLVPAHPAETSSFGAKARVYRAQVKYGLVWVCLGTPAQPVPSFPEGDDSSFRQVLAGPYRFHAYATRVLENFLDAGHYPFLHASQMAAGTRYEMEKYHVQPTSDGPAAKDVLTHRIWREGPNGTGEVDVTYSFQVLRPLTAHYTKAYRSERFAMMDTVTPVDEAESLVWSIMALNYSTENSDDALLDYQDALTRQDIPIVESQRPQLLPLDPVQEIHTPSDELALAYRQWLKKLGLKYGTL